MAATKGLNFAVLTAGTELETPTGIGRFRSYKMGNFRRQNVLVEFFRGKTVWFPEDVLKLVPAEGRQVPRGTNKARTSSLEDLYYLL
ncbi:hypothetical protein [Pontibacter chinhatensis]|uniref:Uncharacterized protein n=1 Tax=Pontibacter chinhatensis TaxID=1436961 RepID=A0A1I2ZWI7_9BACT|nr:hypothetical protein [Pontibacter chinhatensis]SFH42050.1 hypothetical protein SAMN05421739_1212 [Pontibacter chinhatensis]